MKAPKFPVGESVYLDPKRPKRLTIINIRSEEGVIDYELVEDPDTSGHGRFYPEEALFLSKEALRVEMDLQNEREAKLLRKAITRRIKAIEALP